MDGGRRVSYRQVHVTLNWELSHIESYVQRGVKLDFYFWMEKELVTYTVHST